MRYRRISAFLLALLIATLLIFSGCDNNNNTTVAESDEYITLDNRPDFSDEAYVVINNNQPEFSDNDLVAKSFERYGELDFLGRCTTAYACIGRDLMPTEERGSISSVKPTGWQSAEYDNVDGKHLYNRCHLIGWQLTGENANEKNLITGTRYMNVDGMLPFENMVADYIKETNNHVLYRVTPIFSGINLVADGVHMEAISVEDDGEGICFNVFCYNNQPGIEIDYLTGISWLEGEEPPEITEPLSENKNGEHYILNTNSKKFHTADCKLAQNIKESNREDFTGYRDAIIEQGYSPCKSCNP